MVVGERLGGRGRLALSLRKLDRDGLFLGLERHVESVRVHLEHALVLGLLGHSPSNLALTDVLRLLEGPLFTHYARCIGRGYVLSCGHVDSSLQVSLCEENFLFRESFVLTPAAISLADIHF